MSGHPERRRILDMLASGQINAAEAGELLNAVDAGGDDGGRSAQVSAGHAAIVSAGRDVRREATKKIARSLRIVIDAGGEEGGSRGKVTVTVPLALAKFAGKLIPQDVRTRLEDEGIELAELLQALDQELPEGRLVDIDTTPEGDQGRRAKIVVEVV
ncbi:MAG: hypothetical protein WD314_10385 [Trueperaceae bacterium]